MLMLRSQVFIQLVLTGSWHKNMQRTMLQVVFTAHEWSTITSDDNKDAEYLCFRYKNL